jgi:hypothetical protein
MLGGFAHMKILQVTLLAVAVILLFTLLLPPAESAESKLLAKATAAYRDNPSPENKAKLYHVLEVRHSAHLQRAVLIGSLLAVDLVILFYVSRQSHKKFVA